MKLWDFNYLKREKPMYSNFFWPTLFFTHLPFSLLTCASLHSSVLLFTHLWFSSLACASLHSPVLLFPHLCFSSLICASLHSPVLLFTHLIFSSVTYASLHSPVLLFTHLCSSSLTCASLTSSPLISSCITAPEPYLSFAGDSCGEWIAMTIIHPTAAYNTVSLTIWGYSKTSLSILNYSEKIHCLIVANAACVLLKKHIFSK